MLDVLTLKYQGVCQQISRCALKILIILIIGKSDIESSFLTVVAVSYQYDIRYYTKTILTS
jgi:hypothetical protein